MIARLRGILLAKRPPWLILDVQGVGYELEAPMATFYGLSEIGEAVTLYTHLLVRDDALRLFGFADQQQQQLFRILIKVSGVGAKMALAILSGMDADEFRQCLQERDVAQLTRLPGIGKKTGERLIVEMRDRLSGAGDSNLPLADDPQDHAAAQDDPVKDAISALIALGYKPQDARQRVRAVASADVDSAHIIRAALRFAGRGS